MSANQPIDGDDGLPAEEVGSWALEKHTYLRRYIDICRATRRQYLGPARAGATYTDLFCGYGRARIRETGEWIDGSAVAAWKASQDGGAPFSQVLIADVDDVRRNACAQRLRRLDAPVVELQGNALQAAQEAARTLNPYGLHFAFIDPYNLGELDFSILQALSTLKRIDMLIHVSVMDLQRNLDRNIQATGGALDIFAPGWRERVDVRASQAEIRSSLMEYWRDKVAGLGTDTNKNVRLITGERNQRLYWLLLAARHELAHKFWDVAANTDGQGTLL